MARYESLNKYEVLSFLERTNPDVWRLYEYQEIEQFRTVYGLEYWIWFPEKEGEINDRGDMMKSELKIFTTENDDKVFVRKTDGGKISIMINDGDGKGFFTVKEAKELIEIIRKAIINNLK